MADYKELLRRAISALPENNGAARRAVYEKARSALVGQLRAITPPLPARDITQHRLQLEDCIRQVEQEASEAVISLGRENSFAAKFTSRPDAPAPSPRAFAPPPAPVVPPPEVAPERSVDPVVEPDAPEVHEEPEVASAPVVVAAASADLDETTSIEDIIAQATTAGGGSVEKVKAADADEEAPKPVVVPELVMPDLSQERPPEVPLKVPSFEARQTGPSRVSEPSRLAARLTPSGGGQATARQPVFAQTGPATAAQINPALSSVREVELDTSVTPAEEAEIVMASAIEALDREARGDVAPSVDEPNPFEIRRTPTSETAAEAERGAFGVAARDDADESDGNFEERSARGRSGGGLTIFLIVFAALLAGAGGAGFWAWREGYVDLDQMFGRAQTVAVDTTTNQPTINTPSLEMGTPNGTEPNADSSGGPGNTATSSPAEPTSALEGLETEDRLVPTPVTPNGTEPSLPGVGTSEPKTEERLPGQDTSAAALNDPANSVDPAVLAGSQSLLLEASQDGRTGAVPFSGTIEWTEGQDEIGLPTLIGKASIPARNLGVQVTIRKNSDPSLPASHLMEVDFQVSDSFIGGTIAGLPGVLLKNEELVPGTPLVGASARVVGNSFLFALSAAAADTTTNTNLLKTGRWMDLAVVYGTGRNAIITLEKDAAAQAMFDQVFTAWAK